MVRDWKKTLERNRRRTLVKHMKRMCDKGQEENISKAHDEDK